MLRLCRIAFPFAVPLILATACSPNSPPRSEDKDTSAEVESTPLLAVTGATIIDGTGAPPLRNAAVVIEGADISCVGDCEIPDGARVVDAMGRYIIPGLVDADVHYELTGWVDGFPGVYPGIDVSDRYPYPEVLADLRENPERFHRSYLCSGVTAVFNPGGYAWTLPFRDEGERSTAAPHFASAGPLLTSQEQIIPHPAAGEFSIHMEDEETVREAVRMLADFGSDGVKLHRPDLIQDRDRRRVLLQAAGEEAEQAGLRVIANAPTLESAKDALRAGASLFVYPVEDTLVDEEFIELARQNHLVYTSGFEVGVGARELAARTFPEDRVPLDCVDSATLRKIRLTDSLPDAGDETGPAIIPERDERVHDIRTRNLLRLHEAGITVAVGASGSSPDRCVTPLRRLECDVYAAARGTGSGPSRSAFQGT